MVGKEKIKLKGKAGEPLEGWPLRWRDKGSQIWHEYLYMMGALALLQEQWVALTTETPDTYFCPLQLWAKFDWNCNPRRKAIHTLSLCSTFWTEFFKRCRNPI